MRNRAIADLKWRHMFFTYLLCLMMFACPYSALGKDIPKALAGGNPEGCDEADFSVETLKKKYPEWYALVETAVKTAGETNSAIDCSPLMNELISHLRIPTKKSAIEIYDFIKSLERHETGMQFRDVLKKETANIGLASPKYVSYAGYFIKAIFHGETIFGTPDICNYRARSDVPTIIFGPDSSSILAGSDGPDFSFLFGGDGDDILGGGGDVTADGFNGHVLVGGKGNDVYLFPNWGAAHIVEENTPEAGVNVLRVGGNIKPEDLYFSVSDETLRIFYEPAVKETKKWKMVSLRILNWTPLYPERFIDDPIYRRNWDPTKVVDYPPIQRIEFSDGTILDGQDILKIMESYEKAK